MDLDRPLNICHTCLSVDRQLYPLTKFQSLQELILLLQVNHSTARVCWECRSTIIKFYNLKKKADIAQKLLSDVLYNGNVVCLSTLEFSKNQSFFEFKHTYDPKTQECEEVKCVKEENTSLYVEIDTYNEDFEEIVTKSENDVLYNSEMSDNEENEYDFKKMREFKDDVIKMENCEEERSVASGEKCKASVNVEVDIKLTESAEEVMKKYLKIEMTDEELHYQREQKRNNPNFKKLLYKCDTCLIGFNKVENFNEHIKRKHDHIDDNNMGTIDHEYCCDICKSRFASPHQAQRHRERHYIKYKCLLCKYESSDQRFILSHCKDKHNKDAAGRIHCSLCSVVSFTPDEYSEHLKTEHSETFKTCGDKLQGKNSVKARMRPVHPNKPRFTCDKCSKTFVTKSRFETHMTSHDVNKPKKKAYCSDCDMQFKSMNNYRGHLKNSANHVTERYQCSECNSVFVTDKNRKIHYIFNHLKKSEHKCEKCNKIFRSNSRLKEHQRVHHGLHRPRNHECDVCGNKFHSNAVLKRHKLIHSEERTYMCAECGDAFKHPGTLYRHKLVHTRDKKVYKKQKKSRD